MKLGTSQRLALLAGAVALATPSLAACGSDSDSGGGSAKPITVQFASHIGESAAHSVEAKWLMDRVTELTDGQVKFEAHYAASLLPPEEVMAGLQDGRVDMAYWAPAYNPADMPLSQAAGIPFVSNNPDAYAKALRAVYADNDAFGEEFKRNRVKVLTFQTSSVSVLGSKKPVQTVEQLDKLKVRSVGYQALAFEQAGSAVAAIPLNDAIESLERGLLDAYSGVPMDTAVSLGLPDVTKEMTAPGTGIPALIVFGVGQKAFDSWPDNVQKAFEQAGDELYEQATTISTEAGDQACQNLKKAGITPTVWDDAEIQKWADLLGDKAADEWMKAAKGGGVDESTAKSFYDELRSKVKDEESKSDYQDAVYACAAG